MPTRFPYYEEFTDCSGIKRKFLISFKDLGDTKYFRAREETDTETEDGYEFGSINNSIPHGLGELNQNIKKGLSTKYLSQNSEKPSLEFFQAKGELSCDGVVIDGRFITYEEFSQILSTHSGFDFELKIKGKSDS